MTKQKIIDKALEGLRANGGITISVVDGSEPSSGYAYSPYVSQEETTPIAFMDEAPLWLASYVWIHRNALALPGNYLGLWQDDDTVYMDISCVEPDFDKAIAGAKASYQLAIYDIANKKEIRI